MRRPAALAAAALLAGVGLCGCETTAEKSAKLEAQAKREAALHPERVQKGLSIARASSRARVIGATVVHSAEGAAAAVTVRNLTGETLRAIPIAITVKDASGRTLYQNNAPGLEAGLTSIGSLPAHGSLTWVDDQVPATGPPATVTARLGEAPSTSGPAPRIEAQGAHLGEEATGEAAGTAHNVSGVTQQKLVVYVLGRQGGKIVAAGRAVLPEVAAGASTPYHAFLVGSAAGASLQVSAPATTFG